MFFGPFLIDEKFIIYKTKLSYVFTNLRPAIEGHCLVSPIRKIQFFSDLTIEEKSDLVNTANYVCNKLTKKLNKEGYSMSLQDGPIAGQTVPHVHIHILPRKFPTKFQVTKDVPDIIREEISKKYKMFLEEKE